MQAEPRVVLKGFCTTLATSHRHSTVIGDRNFKSRLYSRWLTWRRTRPRPACTPIIGAPGRHPKPHHLVPPPSMSAALVPVRPRSSRARCPTARSLFVDETAPEHRKKNQNRQTNQENEDPAICPTPRQEFSTQTLAVSRPSSNANLVNLQARAANVAPKTPRSLNKSQPLTSASVTIHKSSSRRLTKEAATKLAKLRNPFNALRDHEALSARPMNVGDEAAPPRRGFLHEQESVPRHGAEHVSFADDTFDDDSEEDDILYEARRLEQQEDRHRNLEQAHGPGSPEDEGQELEEEHGPVHHWAQQQDQRRNLEQAHDPDSPEDECQEDEEEHHHVSAPSTDTIYIRKARKIQASVGKPKAADYEEAAQEVLATAIKIFIGYLSTDNPYPDKMKELTYAKQAWSEACEWTGIQLESNTELIRMVAAYSWHLRGEMKTAARTFVEIVYGFEMSSKNSVRKRNRTLAKTLKTNDGFVYRNDDGIVLAHIYRPFPIPAIALILTAIEGAINEWVPGTRADVTFSVEAYREVFDHHVSALRRFDEASKELEILTKIRTHMADDGRVHAKVDPVDSHVPRSLGSDAFKNAIAEFSSRNGRLSESESDGEGGEDGNENAGQQNE
ncbi:hypothetical protein A0H81_12301 [Grifola frondosa]|uniref:DUF6532 domain-containing protein n=1 Tax=Grifola frondosa TaxID=5627 RepID=A0A1C7LT59_GRIFR|nr:hypothetical protein A0H81_12301 [Grifola frondosa]